MVPSGLTQICKSLQTSLSVFSVTVATGTQRQSASFSFFPCKLYFKGGACKRVAHPEALHYTIGLDIKM